MRDGSQPTASKALSALKRVLGVLGVPIAAAVSFKAFRAGEATSMARSGYTPAQMSNAVLAELGVYKIRRRDAGRRAGGVAPSGREQFG